MLILKTALAATLAVAGPPLLAVACLWSIGAIRRVAKAVTQIVR
jgi:hypothetical protein